MIRRVPVPGTPLQVVAVLAAGLILVAAVVEGVDALVQDPEPAPAPGNTAGTQAAVPEFDPEIRVEGSDGIVIDFGGHDQTRIQIEGSGADVTALARCLDDGLQRLREQERAAEPATDPGWIGRIAAKRRMRSRFREIEQQCMGLQIDPYLFRPVLPGFPPLPPDVPENGGGTRPPDGKPPEG